MSHDPSRKRLLNGMLGFGALGALARRAPAAARTNKDDGRAVAFMPGMQPGAAARRGACA